MSQKLYVLLLSVVTVSVALKCYQDEVKVGEKPGKDTLKDCEASVTKCNNYTLKYLDVNKLVFGCGPEQKVCKEANKERRRRQAAKECDLKGRNLMNVEMNTQGKAQCVDKIYKLEEEAASEKNNIYCFNNVAWDYKQYMGEGRYDPPSKCVFNDEYKELFDKANSKYYTNENMDSMDGIIEYNEKKYSNMAKIYVKCDEGFKLEDADANTLTKTGKDAYKYGTAVVDANTDPFCEPGDEYKQLYDNDNAKYYTNENMDSMAGIIEYDGKKYSKMAKIYVKCDEMYKLKKADINTLTKTGDEAYKYDSVEVTAASASFCEDMTCDKNSFGKFTAYKDGKKEDADSDGFIKAVALGEGKLKDGDNVYLMCEAKDYVDIYEENKNLHAYKCDVTSTEKIKVKGEMLKQCIPEDEYECKPKECETDGCNAAAQLHVAMVSLLLTIAYILW